MFARSRRLALVALLAAPTLAAAQDLTYAIGTSKYRVTSKTTGSQEAMGQKQEFETSSTQLLSVDVARVNKDTLLMTATIDSIAVVGPMGMTPPGLDQLRGFKTMAKISPFGFVYSAKGSNDSIPQATQLTDEMSRLLPRIRGKLAVGTTWTDTTTGTVNQNGLDIKREVVTKFTVKGDTTVAGEKAWNIARESDVTMSGSGAPQGQAMTMGGTAKGMGTIVVSQKGVFLGSTAKDDVNISIVIAANGMEVGVVQNAETTIERLP